MYNLVAIKTILRNNLTFEDYVMLHEMMKMDIECKRIVDGLLDEYEKAHSEWDAYVKGEVESLYPNITIPPRSGKSVAVAKWVSKFPMTYILPTIKKVISNNPATIIKWNDGSKTVVKCQNGEPFDPEKGFVMAYLKKLLGNDNTFNKEIAKWVGGAVNG